MSVRQAISSPTAPAAIGPYSQAIRTDAFVYCSGQIGLDPDTGLLVEGVSAQAEQALRNLSAVLSAAGCGLADVVKTTIFLSDLADFGTVNQTYAAFFGAEPPARSTIQVAGLPRGALIEIEAIARLP